MLFSYVGTHLEKEFDYQEDIRKMIDDSEDKHWLLDEAFIAICYVINNSEYKSMSTSFSIRDFDFGGLNRKLLELLYNCYEELRDDSPPEEIFPEQCRLFTECNTTFLQPGDKVVGEPPKGAKVVEFNFRNCRNMSFDVRSVLDGEYIKSEFAELTPTTGVGPKVIQRFDFLKEYKVGESSKYMIDGSPDDGEIYQKLDGEHYRKLTNSKVQESDYDLINYNMAIINWENKRILALRQTIPKPVRAVNFDAIRGSIKSNMFDKNMKVSDAVFYSYINPNMSDNDVLQVLIGSQMYQDKIPRRVNRQEFDKLFSIRDLESNII
jgi:hypothetical protein